MGGEAALHTLPRGGPVPATSPKPSTAGFKALAEWSPLQRPRAMTNKVGQPFLQGARLPSSAATLLLQTPLPTSALHTIHVLSHQTQLVRHVPQPSSLHPLCLPDCRSGIHPSDPSVAASIIELLDPRGECILWSNPYFGLLYDESYSHVCVLSGDATKARPTSKFSSLKSHCRAHGCNKRVWTN